MNINEGDRVIEHAVFMILLIFLPSILIDTKVLLAHIDDPGHISDHPAMPKNGSHAKQ